LLVPARLAVLERLREAAQRPDERAQQARAGGGEERAGRPGVERREAVREAGHGAADADAAGVHAAAPVVDRPPPGDVAVALRARAADLHQALLVAETPGEGPLLVVAGPHAPAVDGLAEQPGRPAQRIELRQRAQPLEEEQDRRDRLGEVVADGGAAG